MSEYIDKKSLLAWLEKKAIETQSWVEQVLLRNLVSEEIKAGTFDVHIGDGIGAETLEEIGKRVAEIRAEAAEKERDELRKRVEELQEKVSALYDQIDEENNRPRFRMDTNGNLTRIEDAP
jgi:peptidoglycan hydrolase CwlO-like protein